MSSIIKVRAWTRLTAVLLPCLISGRAALGVDLHVDSTSTAVTPDGLTWATSFKFLKDALGVANALDRIKVAQGIYHPDDTDSTPDSRIQTDTFTMIENVIIEGGYAGLQGQTPDDRDVTAFLTILSGDLNEDDVGGFGDMTRDENSFSVVNGGSLTTDLARLDGFTIRDGHGGAGAGMFVPPNSSPTIRNCTFTRNWLGGDAGGGLLLERNSLSLVEDCLFIDNEAGEGAGMGVLDFSNATIRRCRYENNVATNLGGGFVV